MRLPLARVLAFATAAMLGVCVSPVVRAAPKTSTANRTSALHERLPTRYVEHGRDYVRRAEHTVVR